MSDTTRKKARTSLDEIGADGSFIRTAGEHQAPTIIQERGRYHLYISLACPWAAGTLTALKYKGLEDAITYSVAHPTWRRTRPDDPEDTHSGWHFREPGDAPVSNDLGHGEIECDDALIPDTVNGLGTVREVYEKGEDKSGKYSTPLLWDKKTSTIVCNESVYILKAFDKNFQDICKHPERKLFTDETQAEADELNEWIYPNINNGVYRCGFATKQGAYNKAVGDLFGALDKLEDILSKKNTIFLLSEEISWLDIRVYHTLVRFDPVYITYFKTNVKRLTDYPNLLALVRRCYAVPEVKATTNIRHIKCHYFTSHHRLNTYAIIPDYDGPSLE